MNRRLLQNLVLAVLFLLTGVLGLGVRRAILDTQYDAYGQDLPFTLESALHYRRVKMLYDRGSIPPVDPMVQAPEGIHTFRAYTVGAEYIQAPLMHLFPDSMDPHHRLRWIDAAFFCLGIPLLGIWVMVSTRSVTGGMFASLLYAVSAAAVVRSTGQELSRETFAIPLMIGSLAAEALAFRAASARRCAGWGMVSAAALFGALAFWDMTQFYIAAMALISILYLLVRPRVITASWLSTRLLQVSAVMACGLLVPYHRAHGLLGSPVFLVLLLMTVLAFWRAPGRWPWFDRIREHAAGRLLTGKAGGLVAGVLFLVAAGYGAYAQSYGHFGSLVAAKIRYLNQKPADPALLDFAQRVMWVPALHAPDWALTFLYFPVLLFVSVLTGLLVLPASRKPFQPSHYSVIWYFLVSLAAFGLFVRFHVLVAVFAAALAGTGVAMALASRRMWIRWPVPVVVALAFCAEAGNTLHDPARWGRWNVYYPEMKELANWLYEEAAPDTVLANMGVSGFIAAYGKCGIVLHPKFESPEIRDRYERYGRLLFGSSEEDFRDFTEEMGARWYVYSIGEFSDRKPEWQMRYFVNRLDPPDTAPARLFEFRPEELTYFKRVWGNRKYVVYAYRSKADELHAADLASQARTALEEGRVRDAESLAVEALSLDETAREALDVLKHTGALLDQGFEYRPPEPVAP